MGKSRSLLFFIPIFSFLCPELVRPNILIMSSTAKDIVKSPLLIQKEAELAGLEKQRKKILNQIKKTKTSLEELQQEFMNLQQTVSTGIFNRLEDCVSLRKEVVKLLREIESSKKIKAKEKREIKGLADVIDQLFEESFDQMVEGREEAQKERFKQLEEETEENKQSGFASFFESFRVKPDEKSQQDIRKVFVKLAARFHPDKAKNQQEADFFHDIMQRLNEAYQNNDYEELLKIESQYSSYEGMPEDVPAPDLVNWLDKEIERKRKDLVLLENQLQRSKQELNNIKKSEIGTALKKEKKDRKNGIDSAKTAEEIERFYHYMADLKVKLEEMLHTGKYSEELSELIQNPQLPGMPDFDEMDEIDDDDIPDELKEALLEMIMEQMSRGGGGGSKKSSKRR
jgi:hypothetical protein